MRVAWWARLERLSPVALDACLVVVVAAANWFAISAANEPGSRDPDALAYGLALMMAAGLFGRRRWPVGALLTTTVLFTLYASLDYPGFFPGVPLAVPLYSAAVAGRLGWPIAVSALEVGGQLLYRLFIGPELVARVINDSLSDGALFAAIVLLGAVVRGRRLHAADAAERLQRAKAENERVAQELRVARLVQQQFLPAELPHLPGWRVAAFYRSAREIGGDFYSFIEPPTAKIGIAIGDVTDKGAPAALVMATTVGLLRAEASRIASPSAVLEKVNEVLVPNTPERMFVTCLYMVLDPETGRLRYANAGHNLPFVRCGSGVEELRATGMPLGLMPGMTYEEKEAVLPPKATMLLHSDGLAEAHNADNEMFGFPRMKRLMAEQAPSSEIIDVLLSELDRFAAPDAEQEDDITLVALTRATVPVMASAGDGSSTARESRVLADFTLPSESGNERVAMERVAEAVGELGLPNARLQRLKTAVSEAALNAIEHGNEGRPELHVAIKVMASSAEAVVQISDQCGRNPIPEAATPDLEAKLAGLEQPRGWGLFLIENMVDEVNATKDERHRTIELTLHLKGESRGHEAD